MTVIERIEDRSRTVMRTVPLLPVAIGLILGVVIDGRLAFSAWVYLVVFLLAAVAALAYRHRPLPGLVGVVLGAACVGGMLDVWATRTDRGSNVTQYADVDARIVRLRGVVVSVPRVRGAPEYAFSRWSYGSERTTFLLDADAIEATAGKATLSVGLIPIDGRVRVTVAETVLDLRQGERVELFGRLYRFRPPANPGPFDWASYQRRHGVDAGLICDNRENVVRLDPAGSPRHHDLLSWLAARASGLLIDDLAPGDEGEASLLEAVILGHRSRLDRKLNDAFIRAGCIHFLAVSGVHVAIVMLFVQTLLRWVGVRRVASILGMLLAVVLYAMIAEPRPPILRATIMAMAYGISRLLGRDVSHANWIALAAIVLVAVNPPAIYDVGFQLSFAAVMGVSRLTPILNSFGPLLRRLVTHVNAADAELLDNVRATRSAGRTFGVQPFVFWVLGLRWARLIGVLFAVSMAAWLVAMPIVVTHFGRIHPWGPLNSVLVFPLVMLVMGLGFAKLLVGAVLPGLGWIIGWPLAWVDWFLIKCVDWFGALPGADVMCSSPPWWVVLSYYAVLLALAKIVPPGDPFERDPLSGKAGLSVDVASHHTPTVTSRRGPLGISCAALFVSCVLWYGGSAAPHELTVTVLAVGNGSATVIELPDGQTLLYDAGSTRPFDVGSRTVVPFLRHRGISRINRVYISHPNLDHYSGVPGILGAIDTGPVVVNGLFRKLSPARSPSRHLMSLLRKQDHPVQTLDPQRREWEIGGAGFELLWPTNDSYEVLSPNNSSTVLRISYQGQSILLTGDVEDAAQRALIRDGNLHADVLLLPHHGSVRSSSKAFFEAVGASVAIRSSRERMLDNRNGLQALLGGVPIFNTADMGAVQVVMNRQGVRVTPFTEPGTWSSK